MEITNSTPILSGLIETIKKAGTFNNVDLKNNEILSSPVACKQSKNAFGINELPLPDFLRKSGVKSIALKEGYNTSALIAYDFPVLPENITGHTWNNIKTNQLLDELSHLFKNCRSITFDEWTDLTNASPLWLGLLNDVLKPNHITGLDFIFYLGDPSKTLFFQIDELLYIISKFTSQGKVTLVLDEHEAINLWMMLSGELPNTSFNINTSFSLKKKCFSIFRTMNINRLVLYSVNSAILFSDDQQFTFARRALDHIAEMSASGRDKFITGFSFGLLRELDIYQCIALGMIVFGAHAEVKANPDQADLILYINRWIADIGKADNNYLYQ
jgi:hypothetical protein